MIVMMTVTAEESISKTLKNRRRKRKSYSSAAEMLSFSPVLYRQEGQGRRRENKIVKEKCNKKKDEFFQSIFGCPEKKVNRI